MTEDLSLVPEAPIIEPPPPEQQQICSILVFKHAFIGIEGTVWTWYNCELVRQFKTLVPGDKVGRISIDLSTLIITLTFNSVSGPGIEDNSEVYKNVFLISTETGKPFAFHGIREMAPCGVRYLRGALRMGNSLMETREAMLDFSSMAIHVTSIKGQHGRLPFLIGIVHDIPKAKAAISSNLDSEMALPSQA